MVLEFATAHDRRVFIAEHSLAVLRDYLIQHDAHWERVLKPWAELSDEFRAEAEDDVDEILRGSTLSYVIYPSADEVYTAAVQALARVTRVKE
jgi:hypothetical protein